MDDEELKLQQALAMSMGPRGDDSVVEDEDEELRDSEDQGPPETDDESPEEEVEWVPAD